MLTQYLPTIRRVARSVLKYGARREITRLSGTKCGNLIGIAFQNALRGEFTVEEARIVATIESLRARINESVDTFVMQDFGAGQHGQFSGSDSPTGREVRRCVGELSSESSVDPFWASVLFFLIRGLRPQRCIEMGGLVGISTSYQSAALLINDAEDSSKVSSSVEQLGTDSVLERPKKDTSRIVTLEGDSTLAGIVRSNLAELSLQDRVHVVIGRFADTLPATMNEHGPFEFAFVDGHHDGDATIRYFDQLRPRLSPGAIVVFDDVAWSPGMREAWGVVSSRPGVALALSANQFGILRIAEAGVVDEPGSGGNVPVEGFVERYKLWLV